MKIIPNRVARESEDAQLSITPLMTNGAFASAADNSQSESRERDNKAKPVFHLLTETGSLAISLRTVVLVGRIDGRGRHTRGTLWIVAAVQHDIHLTWEWSVSRCCLLIAIMAMRQYGQWMDEEGGEVEGIQLTLPSAGWTRQHMI